MSVNTNYTACYFAHNMHHACCIFDLTCVFQTTRRMNMFSSNKVAHVSELQFDL